MPTMTSKFVKRLASLAILASVTSPALAQADENRVLTALRGNGCVAADSFEFDDAVGDILAEVGPAEMERIVDALLDAGAMWREVGIGMVIHPKYCGSNAHLLGHTAEGDKLRRVFRENGCRIEADQGAYLLEASGLEQRSVRRIMESWTNEGLASREGNSLVLQKEGC